jgi:hypothetical protein
MGDRGRFGMSSSSNWAWSMPFLCLLCRRVDTASPDELELVDDADPDNDSVRSGSVSINNWQA